MNNDTKKVGQHVGGVQAGIKNVLEIAEDNKQGRKEEIKAYPVMEIFASIQGEGAMIGMPVTFIRLAGCNLACPWCDTKESWKKPDYAKDVQTLSNELSSKGSYHLSSVRAKELLGYNWLTIEEIVKQCNMAMVVITGGEPCIRDLKPLIDALHVQSKFICIETNGTQATPEGIDWVVCSPKPPEYMINAQCFFNELKYVVDDEFDPEECIPDDNKKTCGSVWLQPCDYGKGKEEQSRKSMQRCIDLTLTKGYLRTGIQLHKILNVK